MLNIGGFSDAGFNVISAFLADNNQQPRQPVYFEIGDFNAAFPKSGTWSDRANLSQNS
jgi:hypothetical protein